MSTEFDIKLTENDMYAFNMYHAYTSMQGLLPVILGIAVLAISIFSGNFEGQQSRYLYMLIGIVFLVYVPFSLRIRAKRVIHMDPVLSKTIHYNICDEGVVVTAESGESATLEWQYVYKAISTKKLILIFSSRVNAYIIPKCQVEDKIPEIYEIVKANVAEYRFKLK